MAGSFQDHVVVVTGASAGIGRALARAFAANGADVALIARNEEALENAAAEVRGLGGQTLILPLDVADHVAIDRAADLVVERFGRIDVWVNNAMVSVLSPIAEMSADEYRRVTEVTYLGYVWGTCAALRHMRRQGNGTIVQVGSALAYRSIPLQSAYCAAKAAVRGFTDSLRCELIHENSPIRVTMVQLPAVNTPQFGWVRTRMPRHPQPVPPIFQPEAVAAGILWAAEHAPREMTIGWPAVQAVYGQRVLPGWLDRKLGREGYEAQQTDEPVDRDRPDNLFSTVPGDHGARGRFDHQARSSIPQLALRARPHAALAGSAVLLGVAAVGLAAMLTRRD